MGVLPSRQEPEVPSHGGGHPGALRVSLGVGVDPGGKRPSELDRIYPGTWDPDWTIEAIDLLTILTRLVEIEPAQADLLTGVLHGELLSTDDLRADGTVWPTTPKDRKPHYSYKSLGTADPTSGAVTLDM